MSHSSKVVCHSDSVEDLKFLSRVALKEVEEAGEDALFALIVPVKHNRTKEVRSRTLLSPLKLLVATAVEATGVEATVVVAKAAGAVVKVAEEAGVVVEEEDGEAKLDFFFAVTFSLCED